MTAKNEWVEFIAILNREVVPALGCTEPVTVALAAARAAEALDAKPQSVLVQVSGNLLKNGMGVGVPGTGMTGLVIAAAVGALGGNSELRLEVLRDLTPEIVAEAKNLMADGNVKVELAQTDELLFAKAIVAAEGHVATCTIARTHSGIIEVTKDDEILNSTPLEDEDASGDVWPLSVSAIYGFATEADFEDISFILEAARLNESIAAEGLEHDFGLKVGRSMDEDIALGLRSDDITSFATRLAAAASDARMDGIMQPVMSNSGSGNQGITATIPVTAFARRLNKSEEEMARALILSHLIAIHLKHHLGRLSALCGAILAATGSGCGIAMLLGGGLVEVERTIKNMVGTIAGMICDGAKTSCALKVASSVEAAINSALLAMKGTSVPGSDGIVDDDIEICIKNLGRLGTVGMCETDKVILDIMVNK
ncbi:L-serine ammonia-lyase, iron-sulfur-dependent, subunit alpha [Halodesulfovibrio aestuarii]|uniref:L-cysteine desulfidase family protein n=1 Tax=Halodesulfovibrio aestuarii TaxID=126333 RepID=UPI0003FACDC4